MATGLKWYKRDPEAAIEGMRCLTLEERGAYNTILDLIYIRGGAVPDDGRWIAGWLNCDVRVWNRIRKRLVDLGKLVAADRMLTNIRATSVVLKALATIASSSEGGKASAASRASQSAKINGIAPTPLPSDVEPSIDLDRDIEEERKNIGTLKGSSSGQQFFLDQMLAIYRIECPTFAQPRKPLKVGDKIPKQMMKRLEEDLDGDVEKWRLFCRRCAGNKLINGTKTSWTGGRCLGWITKAENFEKIIQGNYAGDDAKKTLEGKPVDQQRRIRFEARLDDLLRKSPTGDGNGKL